jgi:hypothetical protein
VEHYPLEVLLEAECVLRGHWGNQDRDHGQLDQGRGVEARSQISNKWHRD